MLRDAALVDRAALHELITQYRQLPPPSSSGCGRPATRSPTRSAASPIQARGCSRPQTSESPRRSGNVAGPRSNRPRHGGGGGRRTPDSCRRTRRGPRHPRRHDRLNGDRHPRRRRARRPGITGGAPGYGPGPGAQSPVSPPESHDPAKELPANAHHLAEDRFVNHLDAEFRRLGITQQPLIGRTVRISVDQGVCQSCAAGVAGGRTGVLLQFSADHPGLRIEVADVDTGRFSVFEGGVGPATTNGYRPTPSRDDSAPDRLDPLGSTSTVPVQPSSFPLRTPSDQGRSGSVPHPVHTSREMP